MVSEKEKELKEAKKYYQEGGRKKDGDWLSNFVVEKLF
jgi:hypothetical protein